MANNRMFLKCKECGEKTMLAKFYPQGGFIAGDSSGWYCNSGAGLGAALDLFFIAHCHEFDRSAFGGEQYELEYEIPLQDLNKKHA